MSNEVHELADVLNEEFDRIDKKANREKQEINYIMYLVRKDYDKLIEVAGTEDKRELFNFTQEALKGTVGNNRPVCSIFYTNDLEPIREAVLLGWIKAREDAVSSFKYLCDLTDLGREVVEGYRKI